MVAMNAPLADSLTFDDPSIVVSDVMEPGLSLLLLQVVFFLIALVVYPPGALSGAAGSTV